MPAHLYLAPAGAGKTEWVLGQVQRLAQGLHTLPWVILPSRLQILAFRHRLATPPHRGGMGIQVMRFQELEQRILTKAHYGAWALSDIIRYRLLRAIVDALLREGRLQYYAPLVHRPGFIQALSKAIEELKQAMVSPAKLGQAFQNFPEARLQELILIYKRYQAQLHYHGWYDEEELALTALQVLEQTPFPQETPLFFDGFDTFTPLQLQLLARLHQQGAELWITLTGDVEPGNYLLVHRRFLRTREELEQLLNLHAEPLPSPRCTMAIPLQRLGQSLFKAKATPIEGIEQYVAFFEAPSLQVEAREALRWCKERILLDGLSPNEVAILSRDIDPYRPFLEESAAEFQIPYDAPRGIPLQDNPLIAAIFSLLKLALPAKDGEGLSLPRRLVIEAWQSPYFDWSSALAGQNITIARGDAQALDEASREGLVIQGWAQWREALLQLAERDKEPYEEEFISKRIPPSRAKDLYHKLEAFVQRITPPAKGTLRTYVAWLEDLIGEEPSLTPYSTQSSPGSLNIPQHLADDDPSTQEDRAALIAFKEVLRGLVLAEEKLGPPREIDYAYFLSELWGAVQSSHYTVAAPPIGGVLFANILDARGLSFKAVALLGLNEGTFPPPLHEDPFLREAERKQLRAQSFLISLRLEEDERGYFYEALARAREKLLLTRARMAEDGSPWPPSPYWEELQRLAPISPRRLSSLPLVAVEHLASEEELLLWQALTKNGDVPNYPPDERLASAWEAIHQGALVLTSRTGETSSAFKGDLSFWQKELSQRYGPNYVWSPVRLELYRKCPFAFFITYVLGLEPRMQPTEGLDAAQLGSILHRILEQVYSLAKDTRNLEELLATLPHVARQVLERAPKEYGFRPTAWWEATRQEIIENVRDTLKALCDPKILGSWIPRYFELPFGLASRKTSSWPPLIVRKGQDALKIRGIIDRIDVNERGELRIIDYKLSSEKNYSQRSLEEGQHLQLPLYALAADQVLQLGVPVEGFYWHLRSDKTSGIQLGKIGVEKAQQLALQYAWETIHSIRQGQFAPSPPAEGCPPWCPASSFCWHYHSY